MQKKFLVPTALMMSDPAPPFLRGAAGSIMARVGEKPVFTHDRKVRFAATYPENEPLLSWLRKELPEEVLQRAAARGSRGVRAAPGSQGPLASPTAYQREQGTARRGALNDSALHYPF